MRFNEIHFGRWGALETDRPDEHIMSPKLAACFGLIPARRPVENCVITRRLDDQRPVLQWCLRNVNEAFENPYANAALMGWE